MIPELEKRRYKGRLEYFVVPESKEVVSKKKNDEVVVVVVMCSKYVGANLKTPKDQNCDNLSK